VLVACSIELILIARQKLTDILQAFHCAGIGRRGGCQLLTTAPLKACNPPKSGKAATLGPE
jgi:hypothetical protein